MRFARNIAIISIADLIGGSVTFIASPFVIRLLTPHQFGTLALLNAVWGVIALARFGGMDWAYPYFRAGEKSEKFQRDLLVTSTFIATIVLITVWVFFTLISTSTSWLNSYTQANRWEIIFFSLTLVPLGMIHWYLYILRFMHYVFPFSRITVIGRVLAPIISLPAMFFVPQEKRLISMFIALAITQWFCILWTFFEFRRIQIHPYKIGNLHRVLAKKLLKYGIVLIPGGAAYAMSTLIDRLLLGWFSTSDQVALLSLASLVGGIILMLKKWFALVWDPHLVEWISNEQSYDYTPKLQTALNLVCVVFFCLTCLSVLWVDIFISFLYTSYYKNIGTLVSLYLFSGAFSVASLVSIATLIIANDPKKYFPVSFLALLINTVFGIVLIPKYGVYGAVIGTLASEIFIFISWSYFGIFHFANLKLNYHALVIPSSISLLIIIFYRPGLLIPQYVLLERSILSLLLISASTIYLYTIFPNIKTLLENNGSKSF